jgi:hypothetical protein
MVFGGINYLAVVIATLIAFILGAIWYGVLSKPWMKAAKLQPPFAMTPALFVVTIIAELVMAYVLAGLIGHLGEGQVTVRNGVISGAFVWAGFMITTMAVNHRYGRFGWDLTLIDGGHWLLVALSMGGVIGYMGI